MSSFSLSPALFLSLSSLSLLILVGWLVLSLLIQTIYIHLAWDAAETRLTSCQCSNLRGEEHLPPPEALSWASRGGHAHCSDQPLGRGWCYVFPGRLPGITIGSPTGNKSCGQAALQREVPTPSVYDGDSPEESTHHLCSKFLLLWIKGTMRVSI